MTIRILLLSLPLLLCSFTLSAQEETLTNTLSGMDYVVTEYNDTIMGTLMNVPSQAVEFQIEGKRKHKYYNTGEIKKCRTASGDTYIPAYLHDLRELEFVKILEYGKIQLYEHRAYRGKFPGHVRVLYAIRKNLKLAIISHDNDPANANYKKNLLTLIGDSPDLLKLCEPDIELTAPFIRAVIRKYNTGSKKK